MNDAGADSREEVPQPTGGRAPSTRRPRSQAADAYDYLRTQILSLAMAPGSSFTEGQLASTLQTSKTPVREALVRLEHDGLVRSMPRSGYQVTPITLNETRELSEMRGILLVEIAGRVAKFVGFTDEQLAYVEKLVAESEDQAEESTSLESATRLSELHREIDMVIVRALGNESLNVAVEIVYDRLHRARVLSNRLQPQSMPTESHARVLVESIAERNQGAARRAMGARVERARKLLMAALIESSSLMSASIGEASSTDP